MLLLHYSQVVLYEILPGEFYQHHLLLVEAAFLLLLDGIEDKEVLAAATALLFYVFSLIWYSVCVFIAIVYARQFFVLGE